MEEDVEDIMNGENFVTEDIDIHSDVDKYIQNHESDSEDDFDSKKPKRVIIKAKINNA